jgi:hypothetical protein
LTSFRTGLAFALPINLLASPKARCEGFPALTSSIWQGRAVLAQRTERLDGCPSLLAQHVSVLHVIQKFHPLSERYDPKFSLFISVYLFSKSAAFRCYRVTSRMVNISCGALIRYKRRAALASCHHEDSRQRV